MTCKDLMTGDPVTCNAGDRVAIAAAKMRDENIGVLPVISNGEERRLIGILTDRDIATRVDASGLDTGNTLVADVMTRTLVCCQEDDGCDLALDAMADYGLRRIPIVDADGKLAGIVSQVDIAAYFDVPRPAVVPTPPSAIDRTKAAVGVAAVAAAGAGLGAGLMYLFDPTRGRARRSTLRDKTLSAYNHAVEFGEHKLEDIENRAAGLAHEAKAFFEGGEAPPDRKLEARVRARMGRIVEHPHAIQAVAKDGIVTLSGQAKRSEIDPLIAMAKAVRGVNGVKNALKAVEAPDHATQGGSAKWAALATLAGGALCGAYSARRHL